MKKALVIAAGEAVSEELLKNLYKQCDFCVAVDGGYIACKRAGITPHELVGDMDSLGDFAVQSGIKTTVMPCEKDETDTMLALSHAVAQGCSDITLTCALGGRLDHTIANLHTLCHMAKSGLRGRIISDDTCAEVFTPGAFSLPRESYNTFSLFPLGAQCAGVCIEGAAYPLSDYTLKNSVPLGVSNEFTGESAEISFKTGELLVIRMRI